MVAIVNPGTIKTVEQVTELVQSIMHHATEAGLDKGKVEWAVFETIREEGIFDYCEDCSNVNLEDHVPEQDPNG